MKCNECIWWDTTQTFDNKKNWCKCMNPNAPGYKMWRKWNNNLCKGYGERRRESEGQMKTIQGRFREVYGFDDSRKCRDCGNLIKINAGKRNVYKCRKIGITGSEATDIRLKDPACKLFEKRNEAEVHK